MAMSNPIPTAIACFNEAGIAVMSRSRSPIPATRMKRRPATAPSATYHGTSMARTTEKAKKKLWPIVGAMAIG